MGRRNSEIGLSPSITIVVRWGKKVYESSDYKNDWDAADVESGIYDYELKLGGSPRCRGWVQVVKQIFL